MKICVYGAASRTIDSYFSDMGFKLGEEIAKRDYELVFGGGDTGMMGAVVHGAHSQNGKTIGISPEWMENFEDICLECDEIIHTSTMDERKNLFLEKSDAFIITPGGIGTLDEFFEIFTLKKLKLHNKPIVILNINHYYDDMINMINNMANKGFLTEENLELFKEFTSITETLDYIENY